MKSLRQVVHRKQTLQVWVKNTVKLVQGGIARDRIYFPNWAIFRIIQNCKKKKTIENQLKYCMVYSTCL
jgi:hypothetical protein